MVFGLLMTEMITFIFLILPLPFKWRKGLLNFLATSRFMSNIQYAMKIIFIFVFILFIDSLNRVIKVQERVNEGDQYHHHHDTHAKRFYAQRNMYLTGFTLFLSLILNRTFFLIVDLIKSEEKMEVVKKQAEQQSKEYKRILDSETKLKKELEELREVAASHASTKQDLENLKKQASQQQKEYLRLADENIEMERILKGTKAESKKDI
ncbi:hypothetical protein BGX34_010230 [Mortierella sp. NVP85]|nr:hypothetical protein BGX34_010230 [Mortierella sp. NVP85]